ncbi:hypothetical protein D3C71_1488320 [compost metagenome]
MVLGYCRLDGDYILLGEPHGGKDKSFRTVEEFGVAFNARYGTSFSLRELFSKSTKEAVKMMNLENDKSRLIALSIQRGREVPPEKKASLTWYGQKGIGGYAEENHTAYILNLISKDMYVFNRKNPKEIEIYMELKKGVEDKFWCHCGCSDNNVQYVENYKGVGHGYICTYCKRFVQVG